jgi:hypothetical protein
MNNTEKVQDNNYNIPESNNLDYSEYPYLACPYLRQYPENFNPMMYPMDENTIYDDMYRQRGRYYHPYYHHYYHPYYHHSDFPWWLLFFL